MFIWTIVNCGWLTYGLVKSLEQEAPLSMMLYGSVLLNLVMLAKEVL